MNYQEFYTNSIDQPEAFWKEQAMAIEWYNKPESIVSNDENGYPIWYKDGELNICYLALDKHIQDGHGDQIALIYDSPVTQTVKKYTFFEVKTEVAKLAGGMLSLGLKKGTLPRALKRNTRSHPSIESYPITSNPVPLAVTYLSLILTSITHK
jgi:propionyl-CoA synthetase